jgi:putative RecB family exonuclease
VGGGLDALPLRGIIDRLDRDDEGGLVVVDYKTGRAPGPGRERSKMAGVETYALLCERALGVRPVAVRLLYLRAPVSVEREVLPTTVTRQERRAVAVWQAINKAHATGSFRVSPGPLCGYCAFADRCEGAALAGVVPRLAPTAAS